MTEPYSLAQRLDHANRLIEVIAAHGRRFFYSAKHGRHARVEVDRRGHVWWVDDYTGRRIYTHRTPFGNNWRGFSHGGTLRALAEAIRDYITTGTRIHRWRIAPPMSYGDLWGYGPEAAVAVQVAAFVLPIMDDAPNIQKDNTA